LCKPFVCRKRRRFCGHPLAAPGLACDQGRRNPAAASLATNPAEKKMTRYVKHLVAATLATASSCLGGGFAVAQPVNEPAPPAAEAESEIIVEAPRRVPVPGESRRDSFTGAPVAVTTVQMQLLYGDLDLATAQGAESLMVRLERVSQDACRALDRLYPLNPDPECVAKTLARATPHAKSAIAAAQAR